MPGDEGSNGNGADAWDDLTPTPPPQSIAPRSPTSRELADLAIVTSTFADRVRSVGEGLVALADRFDENALGLAKASASGDDSARDQQVAELGRARPAIADAVAGLRRADEGLSIIERMAKP